MLTLLSPAKKLNMEPVEAPFTQPRLTDDLKEIAQVAKAQSADDLKRLMHISDNLAELNYERFQAFNLENQSNSAKQAAMAFDGNVYWGLDAKTLSAETLDYAQDHLRILSGLYGLLRPLDAIQPYRLEMGTKIENPRGANLYKFWGSILSGELNKDLEAHTDKTIVNLASNEYVKAVDKKALGQNMIGAKFLNIKDGKAKSLMYYAKTARGQMARWIMENRVDRAEGLKDFNVEGYAYDMELSSPSELVFTRVQPETKK